MKRSNSRGPVVVTNQMSSILYFRVMLGSKATVATSLLLVLVCKLLLHGFLTSPLRPGPFFLYHSPLSLLAGLIHHTFSPLTAHLIIQMDMVESFHIIGTFLNFNLPSFKIKQMRQLPRSHNIARFKKIKTLR